jgi:hypothetical protein
MRDRVPQTVDPARARKLRSPTTAALTLVLSACATHPEARTTDSIPAPDQTAMQLPRPAATPAQACPTGEGVVVRVVPLDAAGRDANAELMQGGVVGGVLGGGKDSGMPQGGASGGASADGAGIRYDFYVRLDRGDRIILNQRGASGIASGTRVVVENCRARPIR